VNLLVCNIQHTSYILRVSYLARCSITQLSSGSCYCLPFRSNRFFFRHSSSYSVAANFSDHSKCLKQYQLQDWMYIAYIFFGKSKPLTKWILGQYWSDCKSLKGSGR